MIVAAFCSVVLITFSCRTMNNYSGPQMGSDPSIIVYPFGKKGGGTVSARNYSIEYDTGNLLSEASGEVKRQMYENKLIVSSIGGCAVDWYPIFDTAYSMTVLTSLNVKFNGVNVKIPECEYLGLPICSDSLYSQIGLISTSVRVDSEDLLYIVTYGLPVESHLEGFTSVKPNYKCELKINKGRYVGRSLMVYAKDSMRIVDRY